MTNKEGQRHIYVYAHWQEFDGPILMGILNVTNSRGKEIFAFEYDKKWIDSGFAQIIDPDLQLFSGLQYLRDGKLNFGIFLDSSPDRWGRILMKRREAAFAKHEKRKEITLFEADFLLGVFDGNRMGALRFKENESGPFLNDNKEMATPPWTAIRDLEYASKQLEKESISDNPEYLKWLNLLFAPGASLGGARPKASVTDNNNQLWIAKFPSTNDDINKGAWEMITNELAIKSGINIAQGMVIKFTGKHHTYLTRRFDRTDTGKRIHFASAMTMFGLTDHNEGGSYLEFIDFLIKYGSNTNGDLEEIWRRIVFNVCVKNIDDHLRNHGFLLTPLGWTLSPAYDINPEPNGTALHLNISENDNSLDINLAKEVAELFRVKPKKANDIINLIKKEISKWSTLAKKYKIPKEEQEIMSNSFWKD
jgi:serine/threonine-protein kinase HipA